MRDFKLDIIIKTNNNNKKIEFLNLEEYIINKKK